MRTLPEAFAARLARGVTTLAHVWRIARLDKQVFGFTDHDRPLAFDELTCAPSAGLGGGAIEKAMGLAPDSASAVGVLADDAITEEDLALGLWDGARVDLYRVDWTDPALRVHLFAGRLGEARRGVAGFEIELRGLQAPLNVAVGRVYSRFCDADVGDARCKFNLEQPAYEGAGSVTQIISTRAFRVNGLAVFADGWFSRGLLTWTGGGVGEVSVHRAAAGGHILELLDPAGPALELGAGFTVRAGCDKSFATCGAKFANTINFRGFPTMPGNDLLQSGPPASGNDGGKR